MSCKAWREDRCKMTDCQKWDTCTLMNDNAFPPGTKAEDFDHDK